MAIIISDYEKQGWQELSRYSSQEWKDLEHAAKYGNSMEVVQEDRIDLRWLGVDEMNGYITVAREARATKGMLFIWDKANGKNFRQFKVNLAGNEWRSLYDELRTHQGVETKRYFAWMQMTHGGTYDMVNDPQAQPLYNAEELLYRALSGGQGSRFITRRKSRKTANEGIKETDMGYAMSMAEVDDLVHEVKEQYELPPFDMTQTPDIGTSLNTVASCRYKSSLLFERSIKQFTFYYNPMLVVTRQTVLHELAHAVEANDFGRTAHGPTFVLIYAELLARYTGGQVSFKEAIALFRGQGLIVANEAWADL